jgi:hypothetical protein
MNQVKIIGRYCLVSHDRALPVAVDNFNFCLAEYVQKDDFGEVLFLGLR